MEFFRVIQGHSDFTFPSGLLVGFCTSYMIFARHLLCGHQVGYIQMAQAWIIDTFLPSPWYFASNGLTLRGRLTPDDRAHQIVIGHACFG